VTQAIASLAGMRYLSGWYDLGPSSLYVSAGIGLSVEGMRGGRRATPEVAVYDLIPAARQPVRVSSEAVFRAGRFVRASAADRGFDAII
jgi:hypothetical protein